MLTIHVLGVAMLLGGGLYTSFSFKGIAGAVGAKQALAIADRLDRAYFPTAIGVIFLSGAALVTQSSVFGWDSLFVIVGISVLVLSSVVAGVFTAQAKKRAENDGDISAVSRPIYLNVGVQLALIGFAVWAMFSKLGV